MATTTASSPSASITGESLIIARLEERIDKATGTVVFLVGPPGSGKSYTAIRIAERIDPLFTVDNICFSVAEYLAILNRGTTPGEAVILDEAGVIGPSRKWQSESNIALALTIESVRHRGLLTIVTVPSSGMVDSIVRQLASYLFQAEGVDREKQAVRIKPFKVEVNERDGTIYYKYLTTWRKDAPRPLALERALIRKPTAEIIEAYESKRKAVMDQLYRELEESLTPETPAPSLVCDSCGYGWPYSGKGAEARCPRCHHRVKLGGGKATEP